MNWSILEPEQYSQYTLFNNRDIINIACINDDFFQLFVENNDIYGSISKKSSDDLNREGGQQIFPFLSRNIEDIQQNINALKGIFYDIHTDIITFFDYLHQYNPELPEFTNEQVVQIKFAYFIASISHNTQMRKDNTTVYMEHPFRIAVISTLLPLKTDENYSDRIIRALLHDTIEDTNVDRNFLDQLFGKDNAERIDTLSKKELYLYIPQIVLDDEESLNSEEIYQIQQIINIYAGDVSRISTWNYDDQTRHEKRIPAVEKLQKAFDISEVLAQKLKNILKGKRNEEYYGDVFIEDCIKAIDRAESLATMEDWIWGKVEKKIRETIKYLLPNLKILSRISYNLIILHINDLISRKKLSIEPILSDLKLNEEEWEQVCSLFSAVKSIVRQKLISKVVTKDWTVIDNIQNWDKSNTISATIVTEVISILADQKWNIVKLNQNSPMEMEV